MEKRFLKIVIPFTFLFLIFFWSCLPMVDREYTVTVRNCTRDTILIAGSQYNSIDSVLCFMESMPGKVEFTLIKGAGKLDIRDGIVFPDSTALSTKRALFNEDDKSYFFIIKLSVARKYTWGEICKYRLYDTFSATWDMSGKSKYQIDYKPTL